jgi:hypothetical protein
MVIIPDLKDAPSIAPLVGAWSEATTQRNWDGGPNFDSSRSPRQSHRDFGYGQLTFHNSGMDENHTHRPFKSLPVESKFLLFMLATETMAHYRDWPPTPAEIWEDIEAIRRGQRRNRA